MPFMLSDDLSAKLHSAFTSFCALSFAAQDVQALRRHATELSSGPQRKVELFPKRPTCNASRQSKPKEGLLSLLLSLFGSIWHLKHIWDMANLPRDVLVHVSGQHVAEPHGVKLGQELSRRLQVS